MSKLTALFTNLQKKQYVSARGMKLSEDPFFMELILMVQEAYMMGLLNGAKKFSHIRKNVKVLGKFDRPFEEYVKECEEKFGFKYRTYTDNAMKVSLLNLTEQKKK